MSKKWKMIPETYQPDTISTRKENPQIKYVKMYHEDYVKELERRLKEYIDITAEVCDFCKIDILGQPNTATIKGNIESKALSISHHPYVLNASNLKFKLENGESIDEFYKKLD